MQNIDMLTGLYIGPYKLTSLIGRGERGSVFLAEQNNPWHQVAIKVFFPPASEASSATDWLERMHYGAERLAQLHHPHILPLYHYGEEDLFVYVIMPYIHKGSLQNVARPDKPFPLSDILSVVHQMAKALIFAREYGIAHRHIKATNVLRMSQDHILLSDFDLEVFEDNDEQADIQDFARLIHLLTTGHPAEPSTSPRQFSPDLSEEIEQVLTCALTTHSASQYPQIQDFADALSSAIMENLLLRSSHYQNNFSPPETSHQAQAVSHVPTIAHSEQPSPPFLVASPDTATWQDQSETALPTRPPHTRAEEVAPTQQPLHHHASFSSSVISKTSSTIVPDKIFISILIFLVLLALSFSTLKLYTLRANASLIPGSQPGVQSINSSSSSLLFSDPLSRNNNLWPLVPGTSFSHGAYHINNQTGTSLAVILKSPSFQTNIAYSLTTQEIRGKKSSSKNMFGLILGYQEFQNGKHRSLYSFEIADGNKKVYRFWRYDDNTKAGSWTLLWQMPLGNEFHLPTTSRQESNVITLVLANTRITFAINGIEVGNIQIPTGIKGDVGMSVANKGGEVAFSCLVIKAVHPQDTLPEEVVKSTDCKT